MAAGSSLHPMSKLLLAAGLLLASAGPTRAQGRDTAFAVHKLFARKRGHGEQAAAAGVSLVTDAQTLRGAIGGGLVGAVPVVLGSRQAGRYSTQREQEVLARYAAGFPVPADVRRQLRRECFHRTAQDVARAQP